MSDQHYPVLNPPHCLDAPATKVENGLHFSTSVVIQASFPEILMYILDNENAHGHLIAWHPDGKSFIIRCPKQFTDTILPKFFQRGCKFNSFMRKLYFWGFKRVRKTDVGTEVAFHHKYFFRGSTPLCMHARVLERVQRGNLKRQENSTLQRNKKAQCKDKLLHHSTTEHSDEANMEMVKDAMKRYSESKNMTQRPDIGGNCKERKPNKMDISIIRSSEHPQVAMASSRSAADLSHRTKPSSHFASDIKSTSERPFRTQPQQQYGFSRQDAGLINSVLPFLIPQHIQNLLIHQALQQHPRRTFSNNMLPTSADIPTVPGQMGKN